jgi:hypothetical protein
LLVFGFLLFLVLTTFTMRQGTSVTVSSVTGQPDVVRVNGEIVDMTAEEAERQLVVQSEISSIVFLLGTLACFGGGTWFGWRRLSRIRTIPDKSGWLLGMIAALFVPCFLLWFIPWLIGVSVGFQLGRDLDLPLQTMEALGGLAAFVFTLCIVIPLIWLTYRWVCPKPPAPPSPKRWAIWGLCLVLVSLLFSSAGFGLNYLSFTEHSRYAKSRIELELKKNTRENVHVDIVSRMKREIEESKDEQRAHMQRNLAFTEQMHDRERQQLQRDQENLEKRRDERRFTIVTVGIVISLIWFALAATGTAFGWYYVSRIRKESDRPGLFAGVFAALFYPVVIAIGGTIAVIVPLGVIGFLIVLAVMGILAGVCLAVRWWLRG